MDTLAFVVSVLVGTSVDTSVLVFIVSVDRMSSETSSVEDNVVEVTSATLVDVVVSVVVSDSVLGTFTSDDGAFVIVLTRTVVPSDSEMGAGVVSPPFEFVGVCTVVVVVSGLLSVLLSAPNLEASELSAD